MSTNRKKESGWVIERLHSNETYFFSGRSISKIGKTLGGKEYSISVNDALRFSRKEDALVALYNICYGEGRVAEHVWLLE